MIYLHTSVFLYDILGLFSMYFFLAVERMFWNIPDSSTVYETENRALVSDRTRAAIYSSCNLGKHPAGQSRCSEIFLNEHRKSFQPFEL